MKKFQTLSKIQFFTIKKESKEQEERKEGRKKEREKKERKEKGITSY